MEFRKEFDKILFWLNKRLDEEKYLRGGPQCVTD
jgi:hypothetical protein